MGLLDWFKKPDPLRTRWFFLGNADGKIVVNIEMRCREGDGPVQIRFEGGDVIDLPSTYAAVDAIMELAGTVLLKRDPSAGEALFFVEGDGRNGRVDQPRPLARVAVHRNNIFESYEVSPWDLTENSEKLWAMSWPISEQAMDRDSEQLSLAEFKDRQLDLTLLQGHRVRSVSPGAVASWATIYVSRDRKQALGPVVDVVPSGSRFDVIIVNEDGSAGNLLGAEKGQTFAGVVEAMMYVNEQHAFMVKMADKIDGNWPFIIALAALDKEGFRPLSAIYVMGKYVCEESFAVYRRHPLEASWRVHW